MAPADSKARVYIDRAQGYHQKALDAWGEIIFNAQYRLRDLVRTYWRLAKEATDDARPLIPAPDPI